MSRVVLTQEIGNKYTLVEVEGNNDDGFKIVGSDTKISTFFIRDDEGVWRNEKDELLKNADGTLTGISKNAYKKLDKQWNNLQKKRTAAANAPAKSAGKKKKGGAQEEEEEEDPTKFHEARLRAMTAYEAAGNNAYPHKFNYDVTVREYTARYKHLKNGQTLFDSTIAVAGRVMLRRELSTKLVFYDIVADGVKLQVLANAQHYESPEAHQQMLELIKRGDVVGVCGHPSRSKRGELSIVPVKVTLLAPCLHVLPRQLVDHELRYRHRYLDMIVNRERVRRVFTTRAKIVAGIRKFLDQRDFLEVETPMMNLIAGGATARPFVTHHNELDQKLYMRIAPELYLKELVVGGFDRVYEIGKQFRNEGVDMTHNPEFTSCEFYMAYADYNDLVNMTEQMLEELCLSATGKLQIEFQPADDKPVMQVNFARPYKRISMMAELERILDIKFPADLSSDETNKMLMDQIKAKKYDCPLPHTNARLIDKLVSELIEPNCINPTFICDQPAIMSPLAKYHRDNDQLTERFELFVCGKEVLNAYTELNNPHVQRERFEQQAAQKAAGDDEAQLIDEVFCKSLEYGLMPTAGWGMGIDRLTMFFSNENSIREVILFPTMKPEV